MYICGEYIPAICLAVVHTVLRTVPTVRYWLGEVAMIKVRPNMADI